MTPNRCRCNKSKGKSHLVSILVVFGEDGLDLEVRISASLELFAPFGEVDVTITVHVGALSTYHHNYDIALWFRIALF